MTLLGPGLCSSIELKQLCLLKMATSYFVYWPDGLQGRGGGGGHVTIIVGTGSGAVANKIARRPGI